MVDLETERRQRRLRQNRKAWPKWLRSKNLIRWALICGPHVYRLWRLFRSLFGDGDG